MAPRPANPQVPSAGLTEIVVWDGAKTEIKVGKSAGVDGWHEGLKITEIGEDKRLAAAVTLTGNDNHAASMVYMYNAATPIDISAMTHVEFDFYISDVTKLNSNSFNLELTSSGTCDKEEIACDVKKTFVNGWNHIKVDFTSNMVSTGGTLDPTQFDFFRFFTTANLACGDGELVVAVDDLKFTNASYDEQSITVPLLTGSKAPGWGLNADLAIKKAGSSSIAIDLAPNTNYGGGGDGFIAGYNHKGTIDTTGAATFRFFVYTNDAAIMNNVGVELELTSSGTCDNQENNYAGTLAKFVEGGSFKNGWNEVIIPLSSIGGTAGGGADWTKINFMRMFNQHGAFKTGDATFMIRFDEFGFYKEDGTLLATLTNCDVETDWEGPTGPMVLDGEVVIGNTWNPNTTVDPGWFIFRYGLNFEGKYPDPVDISNMKYIEFDLYVSDAMALINAGYSFELTSVGIQDKFENAFNWDGWKTGLANGWNHIQWPLSWFSTPADDGTTCDFTAWNFLRLFNAKPITVGADGLTVAMKNVEFTTGKYALELDEFDQPVTEKEIITFTPARGDKTDTANSANKDLVVKISGGDNVEKFFADDGGEIIYKIPVSATKYVKYVTVSMTTGAQLWLQASTDGQNWTTVYEFKDARNESGSKIDNGLEKALYTFDLTDAVVGENGLDGDYIYIRLADSYRGPGNGWGGNLYYTPVTFEIIREALPHQVLLPEVSTEVKDWNWGASLNASQGSFSVSTVIPAGNEALGNAAINGFYMTKEGVDTTGTDTFTFDFYISNAEAIKNATINLELTSGGQPDKEEANYVNQSLDTLVEGGVKNGWNTVVLPLAKMGDKDKADWTRINCFRMFFMPGVVPGDNDLVVAYDNLRFTGADDKVVVLTDCEPDYNNWHEAAIIEMDGKRVFGKTLKDTFGNYVLHMYYQNPEAPMDIAHLKYVEFDIYFTDVDAIKDVVFEVEINSSGDWDKNDLFCRKAIKDYNLVDGWNHVKIPLSEMINENGPFDASAVKWIRLFTHTADVAVDEFTFAFTNLRFTDDKAPVIETPANPETPDDPKPPVDDDAALDAEEATKTETCVPLFGANTTWGDAWVVDKEDKKAGSGSLSLNLNGKTGNIITPVMFENKIDATGMTTLEFSIYLSDLGILDHLGKLPDGQLEIFSGGEPDKEERSIRVIILMQLLKEQNAKVGWNDVSIDLRSMDPVGGDLALDRIDGIRFYFVGLTDCGQDWTIKIDNIRLTKEVEEIPEGTKTDEYKFNVLAESELKYLDPDFTANVNSPHNTLRFAGEAAYFIYKYDLTSFRGVKEITFEATMGGQIHMWASADGKAWVEIYKTENNTTKYMTHDLSALAEAVATTATLYVKIGDAVVVGGNGGNIAGEVTLTVRYDANANQDPLPPPEITTEHEKYEFTIDNNGEQESKYLLNEGNSSFKEDGSRRFADQTKYFIYKYDVKNVNQIESIIFKAKAEGQMKLQVSVDKENWIDIDLSEYGVKNVGDKLGTGVYKFDLTPIAEKLDDAHKTIYVKISDNKTDDGYGGCLVVDTPVVLDIEYTPLTAEQKDALEATATEHSVPLWGANKTWGQGWETDNENMLAGSGCVTINLNGKTGTCAPSKSFEPVDASGMDSVEFDIYISHLEILDHLAKCGGALEITSSGTCDWQEKNYGVKNIAEQLKNQGAVVGWNHIVVPLNKMAETKDGNGTKPELAGPLDLSRINYIRFFWTDMTNCEQDWIIKLDNFRMTDAQAAADKAAAEYEAKVLEDNKGLITNLEALKTIYEGELTKDNISAAQAKYDAAKAAFEKLETAAQDVLKNKGYYQHLSKAKKAIDDYKEVEQILKDNAKLIADLEALAAYKDASAFTYENYDAAKAAIEAARDAVDALTKTQKDALADAIAHLTAAEAAMPTVKPEAPKTECTEHTDADADGKCDNCGADVATGNGGGCKSALTIGAVATMILAGAWVTIAARKKED